MTANSNDHPAILVDQARGVFKVARRNFVDPAIREAECERIFDHCWLYVAHGSEIAKRGMRDRFVFTGLVPPTQVPSLVGAMDVLVHTSLREGLARA